MKKNAEHIVPANHHHVVDPVLCCLNLGSVVAEGLQTVVSPENANVVRVVDVVCVRTPRPRCRPSDPCGGGVGTISFPPFFDAFLLCVLLFLLSALPFCVGVPLWRPFLVLLLSLG
jgi:hypothetical protein